MKSRMKWIALMIAVVFAMVYPFAGSVLRPVPNVVIKTSGEASIAHFSPRGNYLVTISKPADKPAGRSIDLKRHSLDLWDVETGKSVVHYEASDYVSLGFSDNDRGWLLHKYGGAEVVWHDLLEKSNNAFYPRGKHFRYFTGMGDTGRVACQGYGLSHDGSLVLTMPILETNAAVEVHSPVTGSTTELQGSAGLPFLFDPHFTPDGKSIVSVVRKSTPTLVCWDAATGKPIRENEVIGFPDPPGPYISMQPDGWIFVDKGMSIDRTYLDIESGKTHHATSPARLDNVVPTRRWEPYLAEVKSSQQNSGLGSEITIWNVTPHVQEKAASIWLQSMQTQKVDVAGSNVRLILAVVANRRFPLIVEKVMKYLPSIVNSQLSPQGIHVSLRDQKGDTWVETNNCWIPGANSLTRSLALSGDKVALARIAQDSPDVVEVYRLPADAKWWQKAVVALIASLSLVLIVWALLEFLRLPLRLLRRPKSLASKTELA